MHTEPKTIVESEEINELAKEYPISTPQRTISLVAKKRPPPLDIGYNELGIKPRRHVLYRNFHEVSNVVYLVEISRDKKHIFILLFPNFEKPTVFIGESIKEKVAYKLMADNQNQFEFLVQQFSVKFNKLQIAGYHTH